MLAGNKTLLEHVTDNLRVTGINELVINLHHLGAQIEELVAAKKNFGMQVNFSRESSIRGTGGGVKYARPFLEEAPHFIVHNGDVYSELALSRLAARHLESGALATLAVMKRQTRRLLLFSEDGQFAGWDNPEEGRNARLHSGNCQAYAFTGIQVLSRDIEKLEGKKKNQ